MNKTLTLLVGAGCVVSTAAVLPGRVLAQESGLSSTSCGDITESMGYRISSVKVRGRWVPKELTEKINELIPISSEYNSLSVDKAIELVGDHLNSSSIDLRRSRYAVTYVDAQVCRNPSSTGERYASILINPYYVQVDLTSIGRNILPTPRIDTPTFSAGIPPAVSALSPFVSGFSDSNYGPSLQLQTRTNLLNVFSDSESRRDSGKTPLNLDLAYRKSFENTNYNLDAGISYLDSDILQKTTPLITLRYTNSVEPLGRSSYWSEDALLDVGLYQRPTEGLFRTYTFGVKGRVTSDSIDNGSELQANNSTSEQAVQAYAVGDIRLTRGVSRVGIWGDFAYPSQSDSYQRVAAQAGYATEVGRGHNTLGIHFLSSAGYIWGDPPQYGRFFGGTQPTDFLYDSFLNSSIRSFPTGPLLRSYGQTQAGLSQLNGS
jgi:hypothetical protein